MKDLVCDYSLPENLLLEIKEIANSKVLDVYEDELFNDVPRTEEEIKETEDLTDILLANDDLGDDTL